MRKLINSILKRLSIASKCKSSETFLVIFVGIVGNGKTTYLNKRYSYKFLYRLGF